jgi:hypothetical protein
MSFDVKMGKIHHRGTGAQRRSQRSDFRFQKSEGKRADQLGGRKKARGTRHEARERKEKTEDGGMGKWAG